jgi:hypothetical protein
MNDINEILGTMNKEPDKDPRYTIGDFMKLNPGITKLPANLKKKIESFQPPITKCEEYMNKHNTILSNSTGKTYKFTERRHNTLGSDESIIQDINSACAMVNSAKDGAEPAINIIYGMNIGTLTDERLNTITSIFHRHVLDHTECVHKFLSVIFGIPPRVDRFSEKLQWTFSKMVTDTFLNPPTLEGNQLSDSVTRTKLHREASCHIMAALYAHNYNKITSPKALERYGRQDLLQQRVLGSTVDPIEGTMYHRILKEGKSNEIKNLALIINTVKNKFPTIIEDNKSVLKEIYQNKRFGLIERMHVSAFLREETTVPVKATSP